MRHYSFSVCSVTCIYRTIRVLTQDQILFWWCVVTLNLLHTVAWYYPYGTRCHCSLNQYVLGNSFYKASADRVNSATAPPPEWESFFLLRPLSITNDSLDIIYLIENTIKECIYIVYWFHISYLQILMWGKLGNMLKVHGHFFGSIFVKFYILY